MKILRLFIISFLALFLEMAFIRYITSYVSFTSYFSNMVLLSCFLGLGVGFLIAGKDFPWLDYLGGILFSLMIILVMKTCSLKIFSTVLDYKGEVYMCGTQGRINIYLAIAVIFIFNALYFIPLGQAAGRLMLDFKPLKAYLVNILGSILGVAVFSLLSFMDTPPYLWFLIGVPFTVLFMKKRLWKIFNFIVIILMIFFVFKTDNSFVWSPYYKLSLTPVVLPGNDDGEAPSLIAYNIWTNDLFHQAVINAEEDYLKFMRPEHDPVLKKVLIELEATNRLMDTSFKLKKADDVLILGAGAGRETEFAVRNNIKKIDAVEIDPVIASLGKEVVIGHAYTRPNVRVYIDDARAFLKKSKDKYDIIVIGFIDSHRLLSTFSSVRLDNFIYTIECFESIREHLKDDGIVIVSHNFRSWPAARLCAMMEKVFKEKPYIIEYDRELIKSSLNRSFVCRKNGSNQEFKNVSLNRLLREGDAKEIASGGNIMSTDDWPFFFLKYRNSIPRHYIYFIIMTVVISLVFTFSFLPKDIKNFNWRFFFLGAAFMLLETKSITRFALLFGSTWLVNSIVTAAILIMVLLANIYVLKVKSASKNLKTAYMLLFAGLICNLLVGDKSFIGAGMALRFAGASLATFLPVFFAGIIFSSLLKEEKDFPRVLGANLLGAMIGGIFEYSSLMFGFNMLIVFVIIFYAFTLIKLKLPSNA